MFQTLSVAAIPFDSKPRNPRLLRQNIPTNLLNHRLARRILRQAFIGVLIIDVVAHAHELAAIVAAGEKNDRDANNFGAWDVGRIGRIGFEDEFVGSWRNGTDEKRVEFLIVLRTVCVIS
jgi:hypothetical protein